MELIRGLNNIRERHFGCVLTIKFGVHRAPSSTEKSVQTASQLNLPPTVMVFEPQPEEVFHPAAAPARLSPLRDKYVQLAALGVRFWWYVLMRALRLCRPKPITDLLVRQLGVVSCGWR